MTCNPVAHNVNIKEEKRKKETFWNSLFWGLQRTGAGTHQDLPVEHWPFSHERLHIHLVPAQAVVVVWWLLLLLLLLLLFPRFITCASMCIYPDRE